MNLPSSLFVEYLKVLYFNQLLVLFYKVDSFDTCTKLFNDCRYAGLCVAFLPVSIFFRTQDWLIPVAVVQIFMNPHFEAFA